MGFVWRWLLVRLRQTTTTTKLQSTMSHCTHPLSFLFAPLALLCILFFRQFTNLLFKMFSFYNIRLLGMGFGPLAMLAVGSPWWASKACATTVVLLRSAPWRRIFRMYSLVLVVCAPGRGHVLPFAPVRRKQQGPSKPSWVPPPTPTIIHLLGHESDTSTPLIVPLKVVEPSHTALFELLGPGKRWFRDMVI